MPWQDFVERQTPDLRIPRPADPRFYPYHPRSVPAVTHIPPSHPDSSSRSSHDRNDAYHAPPTSTSPSTAATSSSRQLQVPMSAPPSTSSRRLPRTSNKNTTVSSPVPPQTNPHSRSRQSHNAVASSSRIPSSSPTIDPEQAAYEADIDNALDLLKKLMNPDSTKRITPRDALYHPFLREYRSVAVQTDSHPGAPSSSLPSSVTTASSATVNANGVIGRRGRGPKSKHEKDAEDEEAEGEEVNEEVQEPEADDDAEVEGIWHAISDDEFFPHPPGEGVCAAWHFDDEDTGNMYVKIRVPAAPSSAGSGSSSSRIGTSRGNRKRMCGDGDGEVDDLELRRMETKMKRLDAGEGMAIGREPCEYHRNVPEFCDGVAAS